MLASDKIPVAMIQKTVEKPGATFHCTLERRFDANYYGWKLAHIERVGLHTRIPLKNIPIEQLISQFQKLMSPANMFVVPLEWSGIAEIKTIIEIVASNDSQNPNHSESS